MTTLIRTGGVTLAAALLLAPAAGAQSIERRVAAAPSGTVRMTFAAREGVCGNGRNVNIRSASDRQSDWESDCEHGPVHTELNLSGGKVTNVATYVGGRWKTGTGAVTDTLVSAGTPSSRCSAAFGRIT